MRTPTMHNYTAIKNDMVLITLIGPKNEILEKNCFADDGNIRWEAA